MRKLSLAALIAAGLFVSACGESYTVIPDSNPPQVVASDSDDDDIDNRNVDVACAEAVGPEYAPTEIQWFSIDGGKKALIQCEK